jgi:thioredoxin 1
MGKELKSSEFEEKVVKSDKPVLVDFYAPWCGPCKMMGPVIEELAKEVGDKAHIFKVNVDEEGDLANQFQVMSIPTIIAFKDGKPVNQAMGVQSKEALKKMLGI